MKTLVKRYSGEIKPEEKKQFDAEIGNAAFGKKTIHSELYKEMTKLNSSVCQPKKSM